DTAAILTVNGEPEIVDAGDTLVTDDGYTIRVIETAPGYTLTSKWAKLEIRDPSGDSRTVILDIGECE
ncbi:hypothetical protein J7J26_03775, partial [Candidatus Micrarchaeota archaeon]|nr:hypothetical protein [Candidatus Micrarchaeota archaeon]